MDKETFANFISNCGKRDFEIACRIVLQDVFNLIIANVDGSNDGGTDFASIESDGLRKRDIRVEPTFIRSKQTRYVLLVYGPSI